VTGNDRFRALAERRVAELAARAGPRRVDLERLATAYLS
jgi:hypothetical protein